MVTIEQLQKDLENFKAQANVAIGAMRYAEELIRRLTEQKVSGNGKKEEKP